MNRLTAILLILLAVSARGEYSLPTGRTITWNPAGLDVLGGIPTTHAHEYPIGGIDPTGVIDASVAINNAIASQAGQDTVLTIPPGTYNIGSDITMANKVILRGAQPVSIPYMPATRSEATTLVMGSHKVFFDGGRKETNWTPTCTSNTACSGFTILSGYTQGSTSVTLSSGGSALLVNDIVSLYENEDDCSLSNDNACVESKGNNYLGEDGPSGSDPHVWQQYARVTSVTGNVIGFTPAIYEVTTRPSNNGGPFLRRQSNNIEQAGLENLRIKGDGNNIKMVWLRFTKYCWVNGVETYNVGANSSGSPHIWTEFSYANEYSANYPHDGAARSSGACYGFEFYHWNSRHKIVDNILRETRHSIIFEGGGSGCFIGYNYMDDNWESKQACDCGGSNPCNPCELVFDNQFLSEDAVANHGAHPYMNLWEGNRAACFWGDYTLGSGSYNTAFRNWFTGYRNNPNYAIVSPYQYSVVEIEQFNRYYNIVGNILGNSTMTTGTVLVNGSGATKPNIYRFGYSSNGGSYQDTASYSTAIVNGNYDYVSDSVHDYTDADHTYANSLYYSSKPAFFGKLTWPPYDPASPGTGVGSNSVKEVAIPAGYRYWNNSAPFPTATPDGTPFPSTPSPTPTASPTPSPSPTATPAPGLSIGLYEYNLQRVTTVMHASDIGQKAYRFSLEAGDFMVAEGSVWGTAAPTDVSVYATCNNQDTAITMSVTLGTVTESAYRTFIARAFTENAGVCTVWVNPEGSVNDFSWTQTIYKGVDRTTPVDIDGGNSTGTIGSTPSVADEAATSPLGHGWYHTAVLTHGSSNVTLDAGTNHALTGKSEENQTSQASIFVSRLLPYATLSNTAKVNYGTGTGAPWIMQSMGFRAAPTEYVAAPGLPFAQYRSPVHQANPVVYGGDF